MNHFKRELSEIIADRDDIEAMNRAAFGRPPRNLRPPALVVTEPVRVNPALLSGDRARIDAFADEMLAQERIRESHA